jgi:hypothetical protein
MTSKREMPMVPGSDGTPVPGMMICMRCEECRTDHRMLVGSDTPIGALPDMTKRTFKCRCRRGIPKITKMDRSLMSINGVPFMQLKGLPMFAGTKWSMN